LKERRRDYEYWRRDSSVTELSGSRMGRKKKNSGRSWLRTLFGVVYKESQSGGGGRGINFIGGSAMKQSLQEREGG